MRWESLHFCDEARATARGVNLRQSSPVDMRRTRSLQYRQRPNRNGPHVLRRRKCRGSGANGVTVTRHCDGAVDGQSECARRPRSSLRARRGGGHGRRVPGRGARNAARPGAPPEPEPDGSLRPSTSRHGSPDVATATMTTGRCRGTRSARSPLPRLRHAHPRLCPGGCGRSGHDFPVAFSCEGRGVCPSWLARLLVPIDMREHVNRPWPRSSSPASPSRGLRARRIAGTRPRCSRIARSPSGRASPRSPGT